MALHALAAGVRLSHFAPPNSYPQVFEGRLVGYDSSRQEIELSIVRGSRCRQVVCLHLYVYLPLHEYGAVPFVCAPALCPFYF